MNLLERNTEELQRLRIFEARVCLAWSKSGKSEKIAIEQIGEAIYELHPEWKCPTEPKENQNPT